MISEVIQYINTNIQGLNLYKNTYGICELIVRDGVTFPAEFCNKDYKNLDIENTCIYHRLTGAVGIDYEEDEDTNVNSDYEVRTYPMRLVSITNKNVLSSEKIQQNLLNLLSIKNNKALAKNLGIEVVSIYSNSSNTLRSVWRDEYNGTKELNHNYTICVVDYDVILQGQNKCFLNYGC
jgi:hypothetical protein